MKLKSFVLAISIFLCLFSIIFINADNVKAEEKGVSIVGEPTYRITNDIIKNNIIVGRTYEINVTLTNDGNYRTDELVVNLTDEEHFSLSRLLIFEPHETKVVSFVWSTITIKNQEMYISFYPFNPDIIPTEYNGGSKRFTLDMGVPSGIPATSTPGFEVVSLMAVIIILAFIYKKRNKS